MRLTGIARLLNMCSTATPNNQCAKEPVSDINVFEPAFGDSAEEDDAKADPYDGDENIDWPFKFCVLFRGGDAQG